MSTMTQARGEHLRRGMTLPQFAAEISRREEVKFDFVADTRRLGFTTVANGSSKSMIFADDVEGEFEVNDHAHGQLGEWAKIPKTYYDRMRAEAPELLDSNVRHWFINTPKPRMVRTLDGTARAFLSNRFRPMDDFGLFNHLLPVFADFPGIEFRDLSLTDRHTHVKTVFPDLIAEVRQGDPVRAGCIVTNSEVGSGQLMVAPYLDRLVCLNGMVVTEFAESKRHVGRRIDIEEANTRIFSDRTLRLDEEAYFSKAADLVRACFTEQQFEEIVKGLRELADVRVEGAPIPAVEILAKRHGLGEGEKDNVLKHLIEGHDLSAWGYVNAVTAAANDVEDGDRRTEMQALGGKLAAQPEKEWAALAAA